MKPRLYLEKSIHKKRLAYKMTSTQIFMTILDNLIWLILLSLPILIIANEKNHVGAAGLFILVALTLIFCVFLYFINALVLIKGSNLSDNRKKMIELLNSKFPNLTIDNSGQNVIRCKRNTGPFNWEKEIIIIFNGNDILINDTTIGSLNIKSPFHAVFNYLRMQRLRKEF